MPFQNGPNNPPQYVMMQYPQQNMAYQIPQQNFYRPPVQQMQMQTYPMIVGRQVNSLEEIRPNEVPNDGSISVFPTGDLSCVYLKFFTSSGTIETLKFVPEAPAVNVADVTPQNDILGSINERLDRIEKKLSKRYYGGKPAPRKEDADAERSE